MSFYGIFLLDLSVDVHKRDWRDLQAGEPKLQP